MDNVGLCNLMQIKGAQIVRRRQSGATFELQVPEFSVNAGQMVCVVGESGCGKSTLLDFLALVLRPKLVDSFKIYLDNRYFIDVARLWKRGKDDELAKIRRRYLGYVLQTGGLLPFLTVRQNLALPARLKKESGFEGRISFLAKQIGLEKFLDEKPKGLSGGQRQRAAILRAIIHKPAVIFADEPTAAVDRKRALEIISQFKLLAVRQRAAVVMVTHDRHLVENVADRWFGFNLEYPKRDLILSKCYEMDSNYNS